MYKIFEFLRALTKKLKIIGVCINIWLHTNHVLINENIRCKDRVASAIFVKYVRSASTVFR